MSKETGGPAFPVPLQKGESWLEMAPYDGMTLRDYFAAKAPSVPDDFDWVDGEHSTYQRQVRWNYFYADLMITERNK